MHFSVLWSGKNDECLTLEFSKSANIDSISPPTIKTIEAFVEEAKKIWGWTSTEILTSGRISCICFIPSSKTSMVMCEQLIGLDGILDVEFTPRGWWVKYIDPSDPLRTLKRRNPERFQSPAKSSSWINNKTAAKKSRFRSRIKKTMK